MAVGFTLDGLAVEAGDDETIWQVAKRHGIAIPHLCLRDAPGYRPDGNCRVCVVEVEGERRLTASCSRRPHAGMVVSTQSPRAEKARRAVQALLTETAAEAPPADLSHAAIAFTPSACVSCGLCVRACREVQVNDVIAMAGRGRHARPAFDLGIPLGLSSCVGCGECVQACPTTALAEKNRIGSDPAKETPVPSLCPYCGVGCQVTLRLADGRIVAVDGRDGPANHNRLCVKGRFGIDYVHSAERLTRPLVRLPGRPKGASLDDPRANFREADWDEALALAAGGFLKIRHDHSGEALAGFGSAKGSNEEAYLFQKLVRTGFGSNHVDHCTRLCHASSVAALLEGIGSGAVTAPVSECLNAEVILVIGANPTVNHPVAASFIKNAVAKGTRLIVADPRGQALDRHAAHLLRFKPGSDVALLNAMMHVIVAEGLENRDYIERRTEDFAAFRRHLQAFTPERVAPLTGIDPAALRAAARCFATAGAAMIFWGMGVSQHIHGTDNARCLIALAMLTGQIGKPGSGLHPLRGQNNVQGASDAGLIPMFYPGYAAVADDTERQRFAAAWGRPLPEQPGLTVVEITGAALAGRIRGLYVMGENPAMSDPDLHHARAALAGLDHLVVQDIFLTETAAFADVVLPASAFPEKTGTVTNTDRRVQIAQAALSPPGQARRDLDILQDLARRLGLDWRYGAASEVYEEMRSLVPALGGISWARLEREGVVTYPCLAEDAPGREIIFGDGFPTPGGRGRFVPAAPLAADELPDSDYPFILLTGRLLEHWHTGAMTRRSEALDGIEPEAVAVLSPADAGRLGVAPGQKVAVATRRGRIECAARLDATVQEGTIFVPFCFHEAPANLLTNPALDPFGKIPEFKFCAASLNLV